MSNRMNGQPRMIQSVFVLLFLAVFAAMSTLLVTLGAQVYRGTVERANGNNQARILSMVVRSSLWAEDGLGEVVIEDHDGLQVLAVVSTYDEENYIKRLFCHDGMLYESFTSAEYPFSPESGESLCEAAALELALEKGMLNVLLTAPDGSQSQVLLQLRTAGGRT